MMGFVEEICGFHASTNTKYDSKTHSALILHNNIGPENGFMQSFDFKRPICNMSKAAKTAYHPSIEEDQMSPSLMETDNTATAIIKEHIANKDELIVLEILHFYKCSMKFEKDEKDLVIEKLEKSKLRPIRAAAIMEISSAHISKYYQKITTAAFKLFFL
ncbi:hypothetical protein ACJX0J_037456, partial [Zea mays]